MSRPEQPSIRLLTQADLHAYKTLRDVGLQSDPDAFTSDFETAVQLPAETYVKRLGQPPDDHFILGAFAADGHLLGAVVCVRQTRQKKRHEASLQGMIVAPQARGQGIGRRLLQAFDSWVRRLPGVEHVVLSVTSSNACAVHLYKTAGFVPYGLLPRAIRQNGQYLDKLLMIKSLI